MVHFKLGRLSEVPLVENTVVEPSKGCVSSLDSVCYIIIDVCLLIQNAAEVLEMGDTFKWLIVDGDVEWFPSVSAWWYLYNIAKT